MNVEANQAVSLLISDAHAWLVELCGTETEPQVLVDGCCDQLENIAMAAGFAEISELERGARRWITDLESAPRASSDELRVQLDRLVEWVDAQRRQLAAEAGEDTETFLAPVPAEPSAPVPVLDMPARDDAGTVVELERMPWPGTATNDNEQFDDDELQEGVWNVQPDVGDEQSPSLDTSGGDTHDATRAHPLLQALAGELRALREELPILDAGSPVTALEAQQEIVVGLASACTTLGLPGLQDVFDRLGENLGRLIAAPGGLETAAASLAEWPPRVLDYLDQGAAPRACAALVELLESRGWPQPLAESEARALADALTSVPDEDEDAEYQRPLEATGEDVSLAISDDVHDDLVSAFFQEAPDQAAELAACLQQIARGQDTADNLLVAQRVAHTLKGTGNLIGVRGVASLAHHLEDIFEALAKSGVAPSSAMAATLHDAADCMETMIDSLQGHAAPPDNALSVLQDVLDWAARIDRGDWEALRDASVPGGDGEATQRVASDTTGQAPAEPPESRDASAIEPVDFMRVASTSITEMFRMAGEVTIGMAQIQDRVRRLLEDSSQMHDQDGALQRHRLDLENQVGVRSLAAAQRRMSAADTGDDFDSLEMDRYDALYGTAHAFIESVVDMRELALDLRVQLRELDELFINQKRLNGELQELILGTRMVPASTLSGRLQRAVRQAGRTLEKDVQLTITGDELALDSDVLRRLADPLMHILRNAVDHGIEAGDERVAQGKPEHGSVQLAFAQEGSFVAVEVRDDGRGFDYERIRNVAAERGLLKADEQTDKPQLRRLIVTSGFSTRSSATQISGRGVGMDVVHSAVAELKGSMELIDNEPCGSLIRIRLPATLIASHCLLVSTGGLRFAVPTHMLAQVMTPDVGQLTRIGPALSYQLGEDVYEARRLSELLDLPVADTEHPAMLLVRVDDQVLAVAVEQVAESRDLVLKGFGRYVKAPSGVTGVSVLGDGAVVPVLDLAELLRAPIMGSARRSIAPPPDLSKKVLIVDDSLSVRRSLAELVNDAGYRSQAARDGLEAVKLLESERPDIILADLEMPRMNGLELVRHVRAEESLRDTPVVMITSRSLSKHRDQAAQAGVDLYLNKPVSHDELLDHIGRLLEAG